MCGAQVQWDAGSKCCACGHSVHQSSSTVYCVLCKCPVSGLDVTKKVVRCPGPGGSGASHARLHSGVAAHAPEVLSVLDSQHKYAILH